MKASLSKLQDMTGFDHRRISKAVSGLEFTPGPKQAKLYESKHALAAIYISGDELDGNAERARLTHHQANIAELDEEVRRGVLVDRDEVVIEVSEAAANMRAKLLNIPHKVAPVIVAVDDLHEVKAVLETAVHEALLELHNQYVSDAPGSGGSEATAPTESKRVGGRKQATIQ